MVEPWVAPAIGAVYGSMLGIIREDANALIAGAVLGAFTGFFVDSIITAPDIPATVRPKPRPRPEAPARPPTAEPPAKIPEGAVQEPTAPPPAVAAEYDSLEDCVQDVITNLTEEFPDDEQTLWDITDEKEFPNAVFVQADPSAYEADRERLFHDARQAFAECGAETFTEENWGEEGEVARPVLRVAWPEGTRIWTTFGEDE